MRTFTYIVVSACALCSIAQAQKAVPIVCELFADNHRQYHVGYSPAINRTGEYLAQGIKMPRPDPTAERIVAGLARGGGDRIAYLVVQRHTVILQVMKPADWKVIQPLVLTVVSQAINKPVQIVETLRTDNSPANILPAKPNDRHTRVSFSAQSWMDIQTRNERTLIRVDVPKLDIKEMLRRSVLLPGVETAYLDGDSTLIARINLAFSKAEIEKTLRRLISALQKQ